MKDYTVLDGQITCLRNKLYDEAYQRGYEDGKATREPYNIRPCKICKYNDDREGCIIWKCEWEQMQKESEYHADPYHADFAWDIKTVIDNFRKESE